MIRARGARPVRAGGNAREPRSPAPTAVQYAAASRASVDLRALSACRGRRLTHPRPKAEAGSASAQSRVRRAHHEISLRRTGVQAALRHEPVALDTAETRLGPAPIVSGSQALTSISGISTLPVSVRRGRPGLPISAAPAYPADQAGDHRHQPPGHGNCAWTQTPWACHSNAPDRLISMPSARRQSPRCGQEGWR